VNCELNCDSASALPKREPPRLLVVARSAKEAVPKPEPPVL